MRALRDFLKAVHGLDLATEFDRTIIAAAASAIGVESGVESERIVNIVARGVRLGANAVVVGGLRFRLADQIVTAIDDLRPHPKRRWRWRQEREPSI